MNKLIIARIISIEPTITINSKRFVVKLSPAYYRVLPHRDMVKGIEHKLEIVEIVNSEEIDFSKNVKIKYSGYDVKDCRRKDGKNEIELSTKQSFVFNEIKPEKPKPLDFDKAKLVIEENKPAHETKKEPKKEDIVMKVEKENDSQTQFEEEKKKKVETEVDKENDAKSEVKIGKGKTKK